MPKARVRARMKACCNAATQGYITVTGKEDLMMTAPLNNSQMKLMMAETMSYRGPVIDRPARTNPIRTLFARLTAVLHRRSVTSELAALTDRELADIGLNRSDLGRVFDPRFERNRHYS